MHLHTHYYVKVHMHTLVREKVGGVVKGKWLNVAICIGKNIGDTIFLFYFNFKYLCSK